MKQREICRPEHRPPPQGSDRASVLRTVAHILRTVAHILRTVAGPAVLLAVGTAPLAAWANASGDEIAEDGSASTDPTQQLVGDGAFSALTMPARVGSARALAWGLGGYDSSHKGPLIESIAEVRVWGPIAFRGGARYSDDARRMRPRAGVRVQLLRQDQHGIDGALAVFYNSEGFTEAEGEVETFVSIGRAFDSGLAVGNLVYGQDPEGNERDGEVRALLLRRSDPIAFGVDLAVRFAIGAQHGKGSATEPNFDGLVGPFATAAIGRIALFAEVGPSALRLAGSTRVGLAAFAGIGSAL